VARIRETRLACEVAGARADADAVIVQLVELGRARREIEDRVMLPRGDGVATVRGVGKLLRILRAGRVRAPSEPYVLAGDPGAWAELVRRCRGATVIAVVSRRIERALTVWTDAGVDRFDGVVDWMEDDLGLRLRRDAGGSWLRIPRESLIRWSSLANEVPIVISVDVPARSSLN
jgi:hypothetical protein